MKKVVILIFWLSILFYACEETKKIEIQKPEKLLSREQMIQILSEVHLAEAGIAMMSIDHQRAIALYKNYHEEILKKHQIDTATYRKNYDYYMQNPLEMEYILTKIEDSLVKVQVIERDKKRTTNQYPTQ
ncbi:MAG: DUF4296 domain-containing protein [Thermoflexibacter sp.]|jgi:hypothetical protein|nr:DUF4296 domain-containing protein [Thermoflexibacter sp.]